MSAGIDIIPRYSSKAKVYQQHRWPFNQEAAAALLSLIGLESDAIVADIGAGTGMSSSPFVKHGCQVYAIEPNADMRRVSEQKFIAEENFHSLDGRADATGLPADFTDLIVVGRALHWFPQAAAKNEFTRISRPGSWLAIMSVACEDDELLASLRSVYHAAYGWNAEASKSNRQVEPLEYFFDADGYHELSRRLTVRETWPQFFGRLLSMAASPDPNQAGYERFELKLQELFNLHQKDGELHIPIATKIRFGQPAV